MIVGGQTEKRAQLSSTIIDYHEPFDQGFKVWNCSQQCCDMLRWYVAIVWRGLRRGRGANMNLSREILGSLKKDYKGEKRLWNPTTLKGHARLVDTCLVCIYQFLTSNSDFKTVPNLQIFLSKHFTNPFRKAIRLGLLICISVSNSPNPPRV